MAVGSGTVAPEFSGPTVLVCFPYFPDPATRRGIDRYAYEILRGLRQNGVSVEVIASERRPSNPLEMLRQTLTFVLQSNRSKGTVYHALDPLGAVPFLTGRKRPLAVTIHDVLWFASPHIYDPEPHRIRFYIMRFVTRLCLSRADAILVPFEETRDRLAKLDPYCASKIRIVPYGLTPTGNQPANRPPMKTRGAGAPPPSMLFIGGDQPIVRGGSVCLRIFKAVMQKGIPARLTFVGSGPQMETIRREARLLDLDTSAEFLSVIPEGGLIDFIGSFDVFVYPSALGFSFLVLQSMEAGTPVVASDDRELREFISGAGAVCSRNDVDGFANAIADLLINPESRESLSVRGTHRAEHFTSERMMTSLIAEYRGLVGRKEVQ
jgi:glycosyltransferase involved in cell wall biosynthesis